MKEEFSHKKVETNLIPTDISDFIKSEASNVEREMLECSDEETTGLQVELLRQSRINEYQALRWVRSSYKPNTVLYPGSGHDQIPKCIFGEDKVYHIGIEQYAKEYGGQDERGKKYFPELGSGNKVIADIESLPIKSESVDLIILLESPFLDEDIYLEQMIRVLNSGGIILISREYIFQEDQDEKATEEERLTNISDKLTIEKVPPEINYQGEDVDIEYFILRKK